MNFWNVCLAGTAVVSMLITGGLQPLLAQAGYSGIWRLGGDEKLWVDASLSSFGEKREEFEAEGYRLVDVEIKSDGTLHLSGIWHLVNIETRLLIGMEQPALVDQITKLQEEGFLVEDLEVYNEGGRRQFMGLWHQGREAQRIVLDLSWDSLKTITLDLREQGLRLIDAETYVWRSDRKFCGVWREGDGNELLLGRLDRSSLEEVAEMFTRNFYNLIDIEQYNDRGVTRFLGVWREDDRDQMLLLDSPWAQFLEQWRTQRPDDTWLIDIETPLTQAPSLTQSPAATSRRETVSAPIRTTTEEPAISSEPPATTPPEETEALAGTGQVENGQASFYGDKFQGKPTASGEPYDREKLTTAHRTHPFGTMLRVTLLETGRSVDVRVNDRGPFKKGRVVDISRRAAEEIGLVPLGVADVQVEVLSQ